ncbi:MAG: phasin family protein [Pontibacterium sp.]
MFQDFSKPFFSSLSPFEKMTKIQARMLERLAEHQLQCAQKCFALQLEQASNLQACKDPNALISAQQAFLESIQNVLSEANEQNLDCLKEAALEIDALTPDIDFNFPLKRNL